MKRAKAGIPEEFIEDDYIPPPQSSGIFKDDTASIIERIDPAIIAERIRHMLLAENFNEDDRKWEKIVVETDKDGNIIYMDAYMNELGAAKVSSLFCALVNSNASLSNLSSVEINRAMLTFGDALADLMNFNYKQYDIKVSEANAIYEIILNNAFFCLKRAQNEGERKFLKTSVRSQETIRVGDQTQPRRGGFKFWR